MSTHSITLFDAEDELGLGFVDVSVDLECSVEPAFAGNRFEPPQSATVELDAIHVVQITPQDGTALSTPVTAEILERVREWVDTKTAADWASISAAVLAEMPSEDDLDDIDYEAEINEEDTFRSCGWGVDESYGSCLGDEE